jgi:hypothetical protein
LIADDRLIPFANSPSNPIQEEEEEEEEEEEDVYNTY